MFPSSPEVTNLIIEACARSHTLQSLMNLMRVNTTWRDLIYSDTIWKQLIVKYCDKWTLPSLYDSHYQCFKNHYNKQIMWLSTRSRMEIVPYNYVSPYVDSRPGISAYLLTQNQQLSKGDIIRVGLSNQYYIMTEEIISASEITICEVHDMIIYAHNEFKFPEYPLSFWSDHYSNILLNVYPYMFINEIMSNLENNRSYFEHKAITYTAELLMCPKDIDVRSFILGGKWCHMTSYGSRHIVIFGK